MKLRIEIDCDNAAFGETDLDRGHALAVLLRELADDLEGGEGVPRGLLDVNGNTCGNVKWGR
jgi:hypothetical protein